MVLKTGLRLGGGKNAQAKKTPVREHTAVKPEIFLKSSFGPVYAKDEDKWAPGLIHSAGRAKTEGLCELEGWQAEGPWAALTFHRRKSSRPYKAH